MIHLEAGEARAQIALEGAEIKIWETANRPLLWDAIPSVWPETAPILFPVVGWTRDGQERVGGRSYPLGLHGFARARRFEVLHLDKNSVALTLGSDASTRALFPFAFNLTVEYRLLPNGYDVVLKVTNKGDGPMPYACGVHPGFRWPFSGGAASDYRIRFAVAEESLVPELTSGGLMSRQKRRLPMKGCVLPLMPELFENDALCFLNARSHSLRFEAPDGSAIGLEIENFPHLALWCRPGNGYLCLEAWTGYSDPEDFTGDLFEKPSMRVLDAGEIARHAVRYSFVGPV